MTTETSFGPIFTDDDLVRLKKDLKRFGNIDVCNFFEDNEEIKGLVARLEAAEQALRSRTFSDSAMEQDADYAIWRKAAGK